MTESLRTWIVIGCVGLGLGGCAAVVVPVAAGGVIGGSRAHRHRSAMARDQSGAMPTTPVVAQPVAMPPMPTDGSPMTVGKVYKGDLPPPTGRAAPPPSGATTIVARPDATVVPHDTTWSDMLHFVAAAALHTPDVGVLLAKGSTVAVPHWLPCDGRPPAVLVALPLPGTRMLAGQAAETLSAIRTMGIEVLFASDQSASVIAGQLAALSADGVTDAGAGKRLYTGAAEQGAALRATIGAHYCVLAIVGSRATDFPNATLPGTTGASPGWFMIR